MLLLHLGSQYVIVSTYCTNRGPRKDNQRTCNRVMDAQGSLMHVYSEGKPQLIPQNSYYSTDCWKIYSNTGWDKKVSEPTVHCRLLCMELWSCRPVRVRMLTHVHLSTTKRPYSGLVGIRAGPWSNPRSDIFWWIMFSFILWFILPRERLYCLTLTCTTHWHIVADQIHHYKAAIFPKVSGFFQQNTLTD